MFTGRAWTGTQAADLGLVDGVADLPGFAVERFGANVKLQLINKEPKGLAALLSSYSEESVVRSWAGAAAGGVLDALQQQQQHWGRYKLS